MIDKLKTIVKRYGIADIYVFGSRGVELAARVRGAALPPSCPIASDVDVAVHCRPGIRLEPQDKVDLMAELEDLFDAPRVDLLILPEVEPFMALDIIRGELIFTEDPDRQARYELYVLRRAADLLPFKKERVRLILEEGGR